MEEKTKQTQGTQEAEEEFEEFETWNWYPNTQWHRLFANIQQEWLEDVQVTVKADTPLSAEPLETDMLLLSSISKQWTEAQRAKLADGIRDTPTAHVLIELKYTQSANPEAFLQTGAYDTMFRKVRDLGDSDLASFLVSSQTPQNETLELLGYHLTEKPGVYVSDHFEMRRVGFIDLNTLSDKPHNVAFKLFASRVAEYRKAFEMVEQGKLGPLSNSLYLKVAGLKQKRLPGEEPMTKAQLEELTPEILLEEGKAYMARMLHQMPADFMAENLGDHPYVLQKREEGHVEGREKGREEGREEGQIEMILKLLHFKFREVPQVYKIKVRQANETELSRITERLLVADTIEQVFDEI